MSFSDEAWLTSRGNVNSQNNTYWSSETLRPGHTVRMRDLKARIWLILNYTLFEETIHISPTFAPSSADLGP
jgi:hypothetical protein